MFLKVFALAFAVAHFVAGTSATAHGGVGHHVVKRDDHSGDATFYQPGVGACGWTSKSEDLIVAIGHDLYDSGSYCGRGLFASYNGKSVSVTVVDRCEGCTQNDLDLSPAAFNQLASPDVGLLHNVQWHFQ